MKRWLLSLIVIGVAPIAGHSQTRPDIGALAAQVRDTERAFAGAQAPFSWEPDRVEALDSGTLALSSGPVRDPTGARVGTFNSVWRREAGGIWRIVFDKGCPRCNCQ